MPCLEVEDCPEIPSLTLTGLVICGWCVCHSQKRQFESAYPMI